MINRIVLLLFLTIGVWTNVYAGYCQEGVENKCQCVHFVYDQGWGHFFGAGAAKNWFGVANEKGHSTGSAPVEGAVIVFKSWGTNSAGHVGVITRKVSNFEIRMDHANWAPKAPYTDDRIYRDVIVKDTSGGNWTSVSVYGGGIYAIYGFIYPKGVSAPKIELTHTREILIDGSGKVGWYPANTLCIGATHWYTVYNSGDGDLRALPATSRVCQQAVNMCLPQ